MHWFSLEAIDSDLGQHFLEELKPPGVLTNPQSPGFLPLVIAEKLPALTKVVGVDIHTVPFSVIRAIDEERHLKHVQFVQADLLANEIRAMSPFDMVTVLHVLEHFTTCYPVSSVERAICFCCTG